MHGSKRFNFNDSANTNNGICIPIIEGCTIPEALNFDQNANTNNEIVFEILGCTDLMRLIMTQMQILIMDLMKM